MTFLLIAKESYARPLLFPWTSYFGSYDEVAKWADTVRGIGRGSTGLFFASQNDTNSSESLELLRTRLNVILETKDVIIPVGGLGSGRELSTVNSFMHLIMRDNGQTWRAIIRRQANALGSLQHGNRIYWQIGNEINSIHFSKTIRTWSGSKQRARRDDLYTIPYYVEYFFAPTADALISSSDINENQVQRMHILLGTIAGARRPGSRAWLRELLNYEIIGLFAPALKGHKVAEFVEIIGIHYLVTSDIDNWRKILDELHSELQAEGTIRGIWATEELGKRIPESGRGAAVSLQLAARYMSWWADRGMTPEQSRCVFWGWRIGSKGLRAADSLQTLVDFLGRTILDVSDNYRSGWSSIIESYRLQSASNGKVAILAFSQNAFPFRELTLDDLNWTDDICATIHVFSADGHSVRISTAGRVNGKFTIQIPQDITSAQGAALMILIERKPKS